MTLDLLDWQEPPLAARQRRHAVAFVEDLRLAVTNWSHSDTTVALVERRDPSAEGEAWLHVGRRAWATDPHDNAFALGQEWAEVIAASAIRNRP